MALTHRAIGVLAAAGAAAAFLTVGAVARQAQACGGTFCDSMQSPVTQEGENILFIMKDGRVEAHIQIDYNPLTDAANFAWVIPVTSQPNVSVGSEYMMDELLRRSVPFYRVFPANCGDGDSDADTDADSDSDGDGVDVLGSQKVGAFDVTILHADDASTLMSWLGANGYTQDPAAGPIFAEYIEDGYLFVALRLTRNAQMDEIHPIILDYEGSEPCVPIRLTRVAAEEDMGVRVFFLGDSRVVPLNYRHVVINPFKLDWPSAGNYLTVLSQAVDEPGANGRAFVTEYAGAHSLRPSAVYCGEWAMATAPALDVDNPVDALVSARLMRCEPATLSPSFERCLPTHPLVPALLARYLPPPEGLEPGHFWHCLTSDGRDQVACEDVELVAEHWDPAAFAVDLAERVIAPGQAAAEAFDEHPYLTRLFTVMSPSEMTVDPIFGENHDLPTVSNNNGVTGFCTEWGHVLRTPDGREVAGAGVNNVDATNLPFAESIEQSWSEGPQQILACARDEIDEAVIDFNESVGYMWTPSPPAPGTCATVPSQADAGAVVQTGFEACDGPLIEVGVVTSVDPEDGGDDQSTVGGGEGNAQGCACTATAGSRGERSPWAARLSLVLLLGLGWTRRARRRRRGPSGRGAGLVGGARFTRGR